MPGSRRNRYARSLLESVNGKDNYETESATTMPQMCFILLIEYINFQMGNSKMLQTKIQHSYNAFVLFDLIKSHKFNVLK